MLLQIDEGWCLSNLIEFWLAFSLASPSKLRAGPAEEEKLRLEREQGATERRERLGARARAERGRLAEEEGETSPPREPGLRAGHYLVGEEDNDSGGPALEAQHGARGSGG